MGGAGLVAIQVETSASRAAGLLLVLASCLGPGDLQPGHGPVFAHPLPAPCRAAPQKDDVGALKSEGLASPPVPPGRRALLLGRGKVRAGEAPEALNVREAWLESPLPACSFIAKSRRARGSVVCFPEGGVGREEEGWDHFAEGWACALCCFCLLQGANPKDDSVGTLYPQSALCPLPMQPLSTPVLTIKRDLLAHDKSSYHLSVKHLSKAWLTKL